MANKSRRRKKLWIWPLDLCKFFSKIICSFGWTSANEPGRLALSNIMQKSIVAFIRTGDPNNSTLGLTWDPWTTAAKSRVVFDATNTAAAISKE